MTTNQPLRGNVYSDMCPGSEGRQVMFCGNQLQCSSCDSWLPAYPGSFLAPVHSPKGILACHQACTMCWSDFAADRSTDHACTCDDCTPKLPSDHRWTDSCACSSCLPAYDLPEGGAWLFDSYGVAYWSPTGQAGTWGIGDDGQPVFEPLA